MDESKWDSCTEPQEMLLYLGDRASDRKLRLLACAAARAEQVWLLLRQVEGKRVIETVEEFVEEQADEEDLYEAFETAAEFERTIGGRLSAADSKAAGLARAVATPAGPYPEIAGRLYPPLEQSIQDALTPLVKIPLWTARTPDPWQQQNSEGAALAQFVREIFGNPFRPFVVSPYGWSGTMPRWNVLLEELMRSANFQPARWILQRSQSWQTR